MAIAIFVFAGATISLGANKPVSAQNPAAPSSSEGQASTHDNETELLQGEQRFRTNCGRCHQPPHKFPPRMMATIIRHMRVRAMLTDEDMRLILKYMTQ